MRSPLAALALPPWNRRYSVFCSNYRLPQFMYLYVDVTFGAWQRFLPAKICSCRRISSGHPCVVEVIAVKYIPYLDLQKYLDRQDARPLLEDRAEIKSRNNTKRFLLDFHALINDHIDIRNPVPGKGGKTKQVKGYDDRSGAVLVRTVPTAILPILSRSRLGPSIEIVNGFWSLLSTTALLPVPSYRAPTVLPFDVVVPHSLNALSRAIATTAIRASYCASWPLQGGEQLSLLLFLHYQETHSVTFANVLGLYLGNALPVVVVSLNCFGWFRYKISAGNAGL